MVYPAGSVSKTARARDVALGYHGTVPRAMWAVNGLEAEEPSERERERLRAPGAPYESRPVGDTRNQQDAGQGARRKAYVAAAGTRAVVGGDAAEVGQSRRHAAPDAEDAQGERESRKHRRCHRQRDRTQPTISRRRRELAHLCHDDEEKHWEVLNVNSSTLPALDARVYDIETRVAWCIEGERKTDETWDN
ncbi:hypothetical protein C8R44DRAFT_733872 [Mycena epipterygia]|nr:hypothetical protein C8R44DRAFT_733872 [Mycena epipterygia]